MGGDSQLSTCFLPSKSEPQIAERQKVEQMRKKDSKRSQKEYIKKRKLKLIVKRKKGKK